MDKLRLPEVLKKLKKEGINISPRAFEYYQRLGLLPKPEKRVGEKGRGVYGYYGPEIVNLVKRIYELKKEGLTLPGIIRRFRLDFEERVRSLQNRWKADEDYSDIDTLILTDLDSWADDNAIESRILKWLIDTKWHILSSTAYTIGEIDLLKDQMTEAEQGTVTKLTKMLQEKSYERRIALHPYYIRLAELHGEYNGKTKEEWEQQQKKEMQMLRNRVQPS